MASTLPVMTPNPYKSRRGWLIAFGIIEILMGCFFLLMIGFTAFAFLGRVGARMPPSPMSPMALTVLVGFEYGLMAAVFFTGGIGSVNCRNWARIMMLVVSALWLLVGLISTLVMAFILPTVMRQVPGNVPPGVQRGIIVATVAVVSILGVFLPGVFLFFYSLKSVKATCLAQKGGEHAAPAADGASASGFPAPLAILGAWQAFGALSVLIVLFVMPMVVVFGVVLHGTAAVLVLLTYSVLNGYAAWAIFRREIIGWQIALANAAFWTLSMLVARLRNADMLQILRQAGYSSQTLHIYDQFPQLLPLIQVGTIVAVAVLFAFILYARRFFPKES